MPHYRLERNSNFKIPRKKAGDFMIIICTTIILLPIILSTNAENPQNNHQEYQYHYNQPDRKQQCHNRTGGKPQEDIPKNFLSSTHGFNPLTIKTGLRARSCLYIIIIARNPVFATVSCAVPLFLQFPLMNILHALIEHHIALITAFRYFPRCNRF